VQLPLQHRTDAGEHLARGRALAPLRDEGSFRAGAAGKDRGITTLVGNLWRHRRLCSSFRLRVLGLSAAQQRNGVGRTRKREILAVARFLGSQIVMPFSSCIRTLIVALAASRSIAAAPSEAQHASPADVAAAQALFEQGRVLMARQRPEEACPKFEESQRLDPALGTEFNLASCYEKLGKLASAYALFTEVAAAARSTGQQQREEVARQRAEAVKPKLTKLVIVAPAGSTGKLRIERDGTEIGEAQWGFPVPVDPGPHRVRAFGDSVGEWSLDIDIPSDGGVHQVEIPGAEHDSGSPDLARRNWVLASAGVGVVGLATGSYFALRAISQKNAADAAGCHGQQCPTPDGVDLRASAHRAGNLATVGMSLGIAGITAAALLWWLPDFAADDRSENSTQLALTPVALPGAGGLLLHARF